jgi:hypothetical protein
MNQTCKIWLYAITGLTFLLQSCVKDQGHFTDDKLLLSKVTGNSTYVPIYFQYDKQGNYLVNYTYGSEHFGWDNCKPLKQIRFINTGTWDFTYNNFLPEKTFDYSAPGRDQGYWKYYYNNKGLLIKTGLAFKTAAEPTQFEFYEYDDHLNITNLIYGTSVDTPFFKCIYKYNTGGDLTTFEYYYPISYSKNEATPIKNIYEPNGGSSLNMMSGTGKTKLAEMITKLNQRYSISHNLLDNAMAKNSSPGADSNVVYALLFTIRITNDAMFNPFAQQGRLLFYQTNRNAELYWNDFFIPLLKSNPLTVEFEQSPDIGGLKSTQTFTYTYNNKGYPVTIHEEQNDPDFASFIGSYTQDKQIEYIKNE